MQGVWGKEILCNRVSLGMIGKSLFCIAVEGAGFSGLDRSKFDRYGLSNGMRDERVSKTT